MDQDNLEIPVSTLIVRFMERLGVRHVFGMPGAHILPVYDSLHDSTLRAVLAKHEQGAAFMAGGEARACGGVSACIATAGPGASNLVTGIANAAAEGLPVLAVCGETSTAFFGKGGLQESSGEGGTLDQIALFAGITRYRRRVERTSYLANVLHQAAHHLLAEAPGPVLLSLPYDVQQEKVDAALLDDIAFTPTHVPAVPSAEDVRASAALLRAARHPMLLVGHGVPPGARARLRHFSERLGIPVATSLKAKGAYDERSPLALGCLGVTSDGRALRYLENTADLVLALGASLGERTSYVWNARLLANKTFIQVDRQAERLERAFPADLAVHADTAAYLAALDAVLDAGAASVTTFPAAQAGAAPQTIFDQRFEHVRAFYAWLEKKFPQGITFFDDNIVFAQNFYRATPRDRYCPNTGISSLGHAVPAAIGAGFGGTRPLFAALGDGGLQMCAMEIMTAVNYAIPLNVVLFNNATLGLIRKNQHHLYRDRFIA